MTTQDIADVCDDAYDLIEAEGWWDGRGKYERSLGGLCLLQAVVHAAADRGVKRSPAIAALETHIGTDNLVKWNDRQSSSNAVLRALEGVADAHRTY